MNQPYYPPNGQPNFGPPPAGAPQGYPQQPNFGPPAGAPPAAPQGYPQQPPNYGAPVGAPQGYPQQQPNFTPPAGVPQGYPQQPPPGYPSAGFNPQAQAQAQANPFFNLNGADPTGGNNLPFLEEGLYHLRFNKISSKQSRKGKLLYIMEVMVLKSTNPSRPAGTLCSAFINLSNEDTRDRSMKQLIAARWGSDPQLEQHKGPLAPDGRDWTTNATESLQPHQPWAGVEIGCHVHLIQKKDGDDFSRHDFMPVPMVLPLIEQALAQQAARGFPAPQVQPQYGAPPAQGYTPQGVPPAQGPAQYAPQGAPQSAPPQYAPPVQPPAFAPMPSAGAPQGAPPQQPPQGQPQQPGWPNWGR